MGTRTVHHLDLYRLADPLELEYFGVWDYFDEVSVKLVEWPERGANVLPEPDVLVTIQVENDERRRVHLAGVTCAGARTLERMLASEA